MRDAALNLMSVVLRRRGGFETQRYGKRHMKTGAYAGVVCLKTIQCLGGGTGSPGGEWEAWHGCSGGASRKDQPCPYSASGSGLQN